MDSFALAYVPSNDKNDENNAYKEHFSVKVNINLWTQCGWDDETPVLDIGLMLSHLSDAKKIRLYLPFQVEKEDLEDLCECLSKDANLLGAVFNEPYRSADKSDNMQSRFWAGRIPDRYASVPEPVFLQTSRDRHD